LPFVTVNGCTTFYEVTGHGSPILFMHGGFGGLGTGAPTATRPDWQVRIARSHTVITYDRRSSGRSSSPQVQHSLSLFANDAFEVLRYLGFASAVIWGESAGVPIATTFALEHPTATRGLVLTDGAPWFSRDADLVEKLRNRIHILESSGPEAAYEERRKSGTVGLNLFAPDREAATLDEASMRENQRAQFRAHLTMISRDERVDKYGAELRTYGAYLDYDVTNRFRRLTMPVLIAYGGRDSVFPLVDWESITGTMDNVRCLCFEDADHGEAKPLALNDIQQFLLEVDALG
jgi:pimeloyl-ACP methyl ester carboxylesterase